MHPAPVPTTDLPAVVPTECVQPEGLSLPRARVDDLCEDDAVVTPVKDLEGVALDPPRAATDHRKPRGRPFRLPRVEGAVEHALRQRVHPVREKRYRERLRAPHVRERTTVSREGKRDERGREGGLP